MALPTTAGFATTGFGHRALRYTSDAGFLAGTLPFLREGLLEGDSLLVVARPDHLNLLHGALREDARRVDFADAATWYESPSRTLAAYHRYARDRESLPGRVRVVGEPLWPGRSAAQVREWTRYESLVNVAFSGRDIWLLCPYDARELDPAVLESATRTHPELASDAGDPEDSAHYTDPAAFTAECDAVPLPPPPPGPVRELAFTHGDLSVVRAFVEVCARHAALPPARRQDLIFAVNEVATNALRHGGGAGRLRYWREDDTLILETVDQGTGGPPAPPFCSHLPADPTTRTGHGLWTVRQLCDLLELRLSPEGSTVRLTYRTTR